jgi:hypothetical protein
MWASVDAALDPPLKARIVSGELFNFTCATCGAESAFLYSLLYHDSEQGAMIWMGAAEDPAWSADEKTAQDAKENAGVHIFRIVADLNHLIEKIRLLDSRIDDRLMELYKLRIVDHARLQPDAELFFDQFLKDEQGAAKMVVVAVGGEGVSYATLDESLFREFEARLGETLEPPEAMEAKWLKVDAKYARALIQKS